MCLTTFVLRQRKAFSSKLIVGRPVRVFVSRPFSVTIAMYLFLAQVLLIGKAPPTEKLPNTLEIRTICFFFVLVRFAGHGMVHQVALYFFFSNAQSCESARLESPTSY